MVAEGEGWREGTVREFGMDMYTLLYLKWITNKELLYSTAVHGILQARILGRHFLPQGVFPTQGLNPGLLH